MTNELMDDVAAPQAPLLRSALRGTFHLLLAAVGVPVLLVVGLVVVYAVERGTGEGFPEVAPAVMAERAASRTQELYDVAGLGGELPAGQAGGDNRAAENTLSAEVCHPDGLESIADEPEKGSYRLGHDWRIAGVSEAEGVPALRRLRDHLEKTGWDVTAFRESGQDRELRAERRDGVGDDPERVVVTWWSYWRTLDGFTAMPCAYDPSGVGGEDAADSLEPPTLR
ncbi:hypothetical protein EAO71_16630 [Streptomyces sp. ms191]|uniref:hypothetical protein n=1 Tax=Streptomyces sp. ms191 TaxID=1827978 RepID=UPI0011CDDA08|nr:hypothetical protein [Streptomyces sp. ms191]TXS30151.1 hypothetical protein EAO71_16630 [Streptomyces sp. ms191]